MKRIRMDEDEEEGVEKKTNCYKIVERILNIINHVCIGFITIYMSWLCLRNKLSGTFLHAWLVTLGFHFLMAEAIMCHYENNLLTFTFRRKTKTTIHWILQVLGGGLGVAGSLLKLIEKKFSLKTRHGKLGFSALVFCLVTMLIGIFALFAQRFRKRLKPIVSKFFHNLLGVIGFILALCAQYYGYEKKTITKNTTSDFQVLLQFLTLYCLGISCANAVLSLCRKVASMLGK